MERRGAENAEERRGWRNHEIHERQFNASVAGLEILSCVSCISWFQFSLCIPPRSPRLCVIKFTDMAVRAPNNRLRDVPLPRNFSHSWVAPIAQLDRASDYGSEGCKFNSYWVHHF